MLNNAQIAVLDYRGYDGPRVVDTIRLLVHFLLLLLFLFGQIMKIPSSFLCPSPLLFALSVYRTTQKTQRTRFYLNEAIKFSFLIMKTNKKYKRKTVISSKKKSTVNQIAQQDRKQTHCIIFVLLFVHLFLSFSIYLCVWMAPFLQ
jgi:hypothetical protein